MKLIIEIDEKTYNKFKKGITDIEGNLTVRKAVRNSKPLQAEFEKIKAEIKKMRSKQNCSCSDCLDIIDNHIKELKGENNV